MNGKLIIELCVFERVLELIYNLVQSSVFLSIMVKILFH